jgi:hypothetical protein
VVKFLKLDLKALLEACTAIIRNCWHTLNGHYKYDGSSLYAGGDKVMEWRAVNALACSSRSRNTRLLAWRAFCIQDKFQSKQYESEYL